MFAVRLHPIHPFQYAAKAVSVGFQTLTMSRDIDYNAIDVPEDTDPEDYHYTARRAEILQVIERAGHPRMVNWSDMANRYGCTRQNIYNDLDVLAEYIDENLGSRRAMISESVFHRCIKGLLEREEYRKAAQTTKDWNEWIDQRNWIDNIEERLDAIESENSEEFLK